MKLDFNAIVQPTLDIVLRDEKKTELHITAPTLRLTKRLQVTAPQLKEIFSTGDDESLEKVWELVAQLMSCNKEKLTVTVDALKAEYGFGDSDIVLFLQYYSEFIKEIKSAKN